MTERNGFHFTAAMARLIQDLVTQLPELSHIEPERVAISFAQARKRTRHGLYATLTPMRFQGGATTTREGGQLYRVQRLLGANGDEMLYILTFYLPRFLDVDWNEKLVTIVHELWHIAPEFNGDLRRHAGRCYVHSSSQREYDAHVQELVNRWIAAGADVQRYELLQQNFSELHVNHGGIYGVKIRHPKLIPVHRSTVPWPPTSRAPTDQRARRQSGD